MNGNDFSSSAILLKGVTCPQEAEFRAYDILLNLNEGDILRQVDNCRVLMARVKYHKSVLNPYVIASISCGLGCTCKPVWVSQLRAMQHSVTHCNETL